MIRRLFLKLFRRRRLDLGGPTGQRLRLQRDDEHADLARLQLVLGEGGRGYAEQRRGAEQCGDLFVELHGFLLRFARPSGGVLVIEIRYRERPHNARPAAASFARVVPDRPIKS